MSAQMATILGLGVMFVIANALPINMGALAASMLGLMAVVLGIMLGR